MHIVTSTQATVATHTAGSGRDFMLYLYFNVERFIFMAGTHHHSDGSEQKIFIGSYQEL